MSFAQVAEEFQPQFHGVQRHPGVGALPDYVPQDEGIRQRLVAETTGSGSGPLVAPSTVAIPIATARLPAIMPAPSVAAHACLWN